ncbi:hypothetical protein E5Q_05634 [Mixia osmundae IAM 14324]|uniref:Bromodomain-containing protein n=1 Tax=Mixia osmundae (strain CBS 9802 / IAM 14324 / JCM 22182 / KY 12970) TaxID=764103 RepID=G7E7Y6_MIXOS|nr:hypothetical protein E5Q_05634 [Mixia osmundae IAM 14324]
MIAGLTATTQAASEPAPVAVNGLSHDSAAGSIGKQEELDGIATSDSVSLGIDSAAVDVKASATHQDTFSPPPVHELKADAIPPPAAIVQQGPNGHDAVLSSELTAESTPQATATEPPTSNGIASHDSIMAESSANSQAALSSDPVSAPLDPLPASAPLPSAPEPGHAPVPAPVQPSSAPLPAATATAPPVPSIPGVVVPETFVAPSAMPRTGGPLPQAQHKFCLATVRNLKRNREAPAFCNPVDPIVLGIPAYFAYIRNPMDLSTVEKHLIANEYASVEEFRSEVKLVFDNCCAFNREESPIGLMARRLEGAFNKTMLKCPPALPAPQPIASTSALPSTPTSVQPTALELDPAAYQTPAALVDSSAPDSAGIKRDRRPSVSMVPNIRRNSADGRSKREIRPPSQYDLEDSLTASGKRKGKKRKFGSSSKSIQEGLKFCKDIIRDVQKHRYSEFTYPFLAPVDWQALNIPDYPNVVQHPMDLGTMKRRLDAGYYNHASEFEADFRLVIENCYKFNPVETPVHQMGRKLEAFFENRWRDKPASRPETEEPDSDYESDPEKRSKILAIERQIADLQNTLAELKEPAKKKAKSSRPSYGSTKKSKSYSKSGKPKTGQKGKASDGDDDGGITFEMKRELANKITTFEGAKLEQAIDIIRSAEPHLLGDESKEIELDIDALDPQTLLKLYQFVVKPKKTRQPSAHTAAARQMDEATEKRKIEALQNKLAEISGVKKGPASSSASDSSDNDSDSGSD